MLGQPSILESFLVLNEGLWLLQLSVPKADSGRDVS
jgi:hypothetical protein